MRTTLIACFFSLIWSYATCQSASESFHLASAQYIHGNMPAAKSILDAALQRYPSDQKLKSLRDKIKEDENQENQNQQNQQDQNQQNKDQQQQEQQNKEQQNQEQQNQEQQDQQQQEQKSEEQKKQEQQNQQQQEEQQQEGEEQQPQQIDPEKLKEMNISEEKARMILEAMRNSEIQYIQQNKRKGTKKPESGKPDW